MLKMGVCWCKPGMMSQCTAGSWENQVFCDYYEKHSFACQCSFLNTDLNNHCWSQKAQDFAGLYGVITPEDIEGVEYDYDQDDHLKDDLLDLDISDAGKRCDNCVLYACSYVIQENNQAQPRGGLTMDDLEKIACKCADYEDESSITYKLGGNNP